MNKILFQQRQYGLEKSPHLCQSVKQNWKQILVNHKKKLTEVAVYWK